MIEQSYRPIRSMADIEAIIAGANQWVKFVPNDKASTLRDLINDILDLSQIESGTMELEPQKLDLHALLSGMAQHTREWTIRLGLGLELDCREDAGQFAGDTRRLRQIVFNLLSNAFKYTPRGGKVTLGGHIEGDTVEIYVADTGSGIAPETMATAFERFSAKGAATARGGAGLEDEAEGGVGERQCIEFQAGRCE